MQEQIAPDVANVKHKVDGRRRVGNEALQQRDRAQTVGQTHVAKHDDARLKRAFLAHRRRASRERRLVAHAVGNVANAVVVLCLSVEIRHIDQVIEQDVVAVRRNPRKLIFEMRQATALFFYSSPRVRLRDRLLTR